MTKHVGRQPLTDAELKETYDLVEEVGFEKAAIAVGLSVAGVTIRYHHYRKLHDIPAHRRGVTQEDLQAAFDQLYAVGAVQAAVNLGIAKKTVYYRVSRYCEVMGIPRPMRELGRPKKMDTYGNISSPVAPLVPLDPVGPVRREPSVRSMIERMKIIEKRLTKLEQTRKDPVGFVPSSLRLSDGGINRKKQRQAFHVVRVNA